MYLWTVTEDKRSAIFGSCIYLQCLVEIVDLLPQSKRA